MESYAKVIRYDPILRELRQIGPLQSVDLSTCNNYPEVVNVVWNTFNIDLPVPAFPLPQLPFNFPDHEIAPGTPDVHDNHASPPANPPPENPPPANPPVFSATILYDYWGQNGIEKKYLGFEPFNMFPRDANYMYVIQYPQ